MRKVLMVVAISALICVPVLADDSGYHEVYEGGVDGWFVNPEQHAELYGTGSEHNQYRWESNPQAQICSPPYYPPEPEPPHEKVVTDEAVLFPWIDFNVYEKDIHWDIFKPGWFMGKTFQVFLKANTPVQILFGSGTLVFPVDFDPEENEIVWDEDEFGRELTDKIRIKSILGKGVNDEGTPPDEIEECLWWYEVPFDGPESRPDPHRINADEMAKLPPPGDDAWFCVPELQGMPPWVYRDTEQLHAGWWIQFFEQLYVEECDSEGKYYKEIVMTVCPDP
jgi:hypothetical protein